MVVVLAGGARDARARHALAVVREVVLALTGVALADLVYVAVLAVGRTLYNHIQHSTSNPSGSFLHVRIFHILRLFINLRIKEPSLKKAVFVLLNLNKLPTTSIWRHKKLNGRCVDSHTVYKCVTYRRRCYRRSVRSRCRTSWRSICQPRCTPRYN